MGKHIILILAMFAAVPVFGQKKGKEDKAKTQADTVTQVIDTAAKAPADTAAVKKETVAATSTVSSEKKDSIISMIDTASVHMDSLARITGTLNARLNLATKELQRYQGMYTAIKEKVLQRDFDPEQMAQILDSLAAKRDSTFSRLVQFSTMQDSLATLRKDNAELKASLDTYNTEDAAKDRLIKELKQLKDLLDAKILTQTEFDTRKAMVLQKWK